MQTKLATNQARGRCWKLLLCPLIVLYAHGSPALADTPEAARVGTTYTVIHLSPSSGGGAAINDKGQVTFNEELVRGVVRAKFYDGKRVHDIGTLGGPSSTASALNDHGQVTGTSTLDADGSIMHAYRWSLAAGIVDLGRNGQGNSFGTDINNKGQVTGFADATGHGFFWTPQAGMLDIGAFGPGLISRPTAMNDAGTVVGAAESGTGGPYSTISFRWTRAEGIQGIGTLPSEFNFASDINAKGHIVGESPFPGTGLVDAHAYLWTRHGGLLDLGSGSNTGSVAYTLNDHDVVVGSTLTRFIGSIYGFVWTRATGLVEFKPPTPSGNSSANDVNNHGQVVGFIAPGYNDAHAFVWTRAEGVVDLNTRIVGAPAGLTLFSADAISDNGSILATSNAGLVLLVPRCGCTSRAPTVGPVTLNGSARASEQLSFSAAFKDIDVTDSHKATWSWGDGSKDVATISEKDGAGNASAQHAFAAPGIYTVTLTVTDSSGMSTTVQKKITVVGTGTYLAGEGWFMSPPGASRMAKKRGGIATFAVLSNAGNARGAAQANVEFTAAGISFRSQQIDAQSIRGGSVQYSGRGSVNGAGGYSFILHGVTGTSNGRIRVRIWHYAPGSKVEVVDYDNQLDSSASGTDLRGTLIGEGAITIHSN